MTTSELYDIARKQEMSEFKDIASKISTFQIKDPDKDDYIDVDWIANGLCIPAVCATPKHLDHPTDFCLVGYDSKADSILMEPMDYYDGVSEVKGDQVEFGYLMYITDFLVLVEKYQRQQRELHTL